MTMRTTIAVGIGLMVAGGAGTAWADTLGGFSGVDRPYVVNQDKVCTPIKVAADGTAPGAPACSKAATDVIAKLSVKPGVVQSGANATFAATHSGRALTITRKATGAVAVAWTAADRIIKVVEVYASGYEDRVAVAFTTQRAGREVTEIVGFDLQASAPKPTVVVGRIEPAPTGTPPSTTQLPDVPKDPRLVKAIAAAKKASKAKAVAAWRAALAIDAESSEARYGLAVAHAKAKATGEAIAAMEQLAKSSRDDAIELLIEARFDKAFAALRSDAKFRAAMGLDRPATTVYERLMGFGGQWEQTGTACDQPEVRFVATRDRTFTLRVKTACQGSVMTSPFKGTWRLAGDRVVLTLPNAGKAITEADETACQMVRIADEDAMQCQLGRDLDFTVLPTRR